MAIKDHLDSALKLDETRPASAAEILRAQTALRFKFPPDYREFLLTFGACYFHDSVVFRLLEPSPSADNGLETFDWFYGPSDNAAVDLINANHRVSDLVPEGTIAIGHDAFANQVL